VNTPVEKYVFTLQGAPKKRGHRLMTASLSILNRFRIFFTGRFLGKFSVKWMSTVPPHLAYVAALPCETLMPAKQAVKDKLQCSVATYLRCGGVINNQIKKGLLLSLRVKKKLFKKLQSYKQERDCLVHLCIWPKHC